MGLPTQSLIRLLVHANEFNTEGLVASASGTPGELKADVVKPELIREVVKAYGQVQPNLLLHHPGFPTEKALLDVVKSGNPKRGVENVGQGNDTEGSGWIIAAADRNDQRPLNVAIWGARPTWPRPDVATGYFSYSESARRIARATNSRRLKCGIRFWKESA